MPKKVQIKLIELAGLERGAPARGLGRNILNQLFPNCVSTVSDATLSEAEHPGLEGPLRKGATAQKQCGSTNRVSGYRVGSPGSGLLQKYPQQFVPYCVSTVPDATLSEAEPPGLEGPLRKGATVQKQCGPASRVNGQRKGWPGSGPLQKHPQLLFPFCVSTVFGETLSEAEHPGLEGPLRKGATAQKQCGPASRVNGQRKGRGGSPLDSFFFLIHWA